MILEPGIYEIDEAAYNADPCGEEISLRSSIAKMLVSPGGTPRHAWWASPRLNPRWEAENSRKFDIGKAAHKLLLGKGGDLVEIPGFDYATNEKGGGMTKTEKGAARDAAWAAGKIPLLMHEVHQVSAMASAAQDQIRALVAAGTIDTPFEYYRTEVTLIWRDKRTNVLCRARLDGLSEGADAINEYKTCGASADPALFQWRQARPLGYFFSMAFYRRGLEALGLAHSPHFQMFVQETEPPYCLSFIRVDDELIAREDFNVSRALNIWKRCMSTGEWPGYSVEGYDVGLSEKERGQEAVSNPRAEHVESGDIASGLIATNLFPKR